MQLDLQLNRGTVFFRHLFGLPFVTWHGLRMGRRAAVDLNAGLLDQRESSA